MKKRLRNSLGQFTKHSKSEVSFVNLSSYTAPEIKEVVNKDYVEYGEDNNYFQYLIDRYNGSPTNSAAINGISQQIYGKGLNATDANKKPEEYAKMLTLLKPNTVRKLSYDLKLMGQCAVQIIYSKDRKSIAQLEHFPIETLRAEKANDKGEVEAYYYFKDWTNIKPSDDPRRIPAYGFSNESIEIMYIQPYSAGFYYYTPVDYQGGIQYCLLEEEISNYHINNIQQGLSPSMLINFNNGIPNEEERRLLEHKIAQKFSGSSNAGKFILAFNDNREAQAEITPVQLSDAHQQYQFLSEESTKKIMLAHRVVSPMLLGIKDSTGLGNNADEIKTASLLFDNTIIRPFQELLIEHFDKLLAFNNITLNLYFITLQPLEFTEIDTEIQDDETVEEETGIKQEDLSSDVEEMTDEEAKNVLGILAEAGEVMSDDYVFVDEIDNDSDIDNEDWADYLITEKKSTLSKVKDLLGLKDEINSRKNGNVFSVLDSPNGLYKIRYTYDKASQKKMKKGNSSREFCVNMMSLARKGIVWTIEDIDKASREGVNKQLGHKKKKYDLFKFKGGVYCRHAWKRKLYRLRANTEESNNLEDYKATRTIPKRYDRKTPGSKLAIKPPVRMPNEGHYPGWKPKKKK